MLLSITTIISWFFLIAGLVSAHPIDEIYGVRLYDQKHILTVGKVKTTLKVETVFYPLEKARLWDSIDTDKNQELSSEEKQSWSNLGKRSSWLTIDGEKSYFQPTSLEFPDYYDFFTPKPSKVVITYSNQHAVEPLQTVSYFYKGKDKKLQELTVELKTADSLKIANIQKSADSITFATQLGDQSQTDTINSLPSGRVEEFIAKYVKTAGIPFSLKLWAFLLAFVIGGLHALTPGHGKSITASYLIGEKGTVFHALKLGIIITLTHTSSVFLLGTGVLFFTQYVVPQKVIKILNFASGMIVFLFGLMLLIFRLRKLILHRYRHDQKISYHNHDHNHSAALNWKSLLPLGISGGIVPCVDALAILIVAVSLQRLLFGLILLIFFSLGLATTLVSSGIVVVLVKGATAKKFNNLTKFEPYASFVSAIIVTLLGLILLINSK